MNLIVVLGLIGFASAVSLRATDPLLPLMAADLGVTIGEAALLVSAFTLPYSLMQLVLGPTGDAVGKARLIRACVVGLCLALAVAAVTPGYGPLAAVRAVGGGFAGGLIPVSLALIGDRVPFERRQVAISRFLLLVIMGQLAGSAGSGLLGDLVGWRGVYGLTAAIAALVAALALLRLPADATPPTRPTLRDAVRRYRGIAANPRSRAVLLVVGVEGMLFFGLMPFLAPLLGERAAGGVREAGLVITGFALGGIGYSLMVRKLLQIARPRHLMAAGGLIGGLAIAATALPLPWPATATAFLAAGFGFFMLHNCLQTEASELSTTARGSALSLFACSFFLGQAGGVVVVRWGAALIGLPWVYVVAGAIIVVLGQVAAVLLGRGDVGVVRPEGSP